MVVWILNWGNGIIEIWFVTFDSTKTTKKNQTFYKLRLEVSSDQFENPLKTDISDLANNYCPSSSTLKNTRY